MYALNLPLSPENDPFWECADRFLMRVGHVEGASLTSTDQRPGVSDSIELNNAIGVTRRSIAFLSI